MDSVEERFESVECVDSDMETTIEYIREKYKELAIIVNGCCDDCREKSIALTDLETSAMWANKAVTRSRNK